MSETVSKGEIVRYSICYDPMIDAPDEKFMEWSGYAIYETLSGLARYIKEFGVAEALSMDEIVIEWELDHWDGRFKVTLRKHDE